MKILITTDWYAPVINGVVTSVLLLQRELEARGHEVRIVTLSDSLHSYKDGGIYYIGSVSAGRIYPGARLRMNRTRSMIRELAEWHPDIIHSQCEFSTFRVAHALSNRLGVPIVHTYHTVYEDYTHYFSPSVRVGRYVVSAFSRWICSHTACIIAPTQKVEQLLRSYGIHCQIEVIPTGVDLRAFHTSPERQEALRQKWQIPPDRTVLLYLGRMAKEKNLETLIDQIADSKRADITLLLVGDGPDREAVLSHARERQIPFIYTGMVPHDEVPDYYRLGSLFVTASTSETQGLTYFEALAAGLPVLCLRDRCVDGVVEDGVNGWQYNDSKDFSQHLHAFCENRALQHEMGQAALASAKRFSAEAFGASAERLYQSLQREAVPMASGAR